MNTDFVYWRQYKDTSYIVSTSGKVYNRKNNHIMKISLRAGYIHVGLSISGKSKTYKVHRLVAECFIPNPLNKKLVNHKDGNKENNKLSNLEWMTHKENTQHAIDNGLIERKTGSYNVIKNFPLVNGKQIPNYENYYVFPDGKIYNTKTKILHNLTNNAAGYVQVGLSKNNKVKHFLLHVLVAKAFIDNPENKEFVNHKDGNKQNNDIINLEWVTNSENIRHAIDTGLLKIEKPVIQYDLNFNEINRFKSITEAVEKTSTSYNSISQVCSKKQHTANNFIWKFEINNNKEENDEKNNKNYILKEREKNGCKGIIQHDLENDEKNNKNYILKERGKNGCKGIIQYDLENNELERFDSIKEAEEQTGTSAKRISANIRNSGIAGGYIWKFINEEDNITKHFNCIVQYDLENTEIERFKTITEASEKSKISRTSISKVCRGERKTSGGFIWKYE
jgi:hypothetical protein